MVGADALSGTLGAFGVFAPGITQVRRMDPHDAADRFDVRCGQALALAASLAIVLIMARGEGSKRPLLYWAAGVVAILAAYELALRDRSDVEDLRDA